LRGGQDVFRRQLIQAIEMTKRAFAFEAGAARQFEAEDVGLI
jgi:hypothetical protein